MPLSLFEQTTLEEDELFYQTFPDARPANHSSYHYKQCQPQYSPPPITASALYPALQFYQNLNHQPIAFVNKPIPPPPERPQTPHRLHRQPDKIPIRGRPWPDSPSSPQRPSMRLDPLPTKRQLEKKPPLACLFCRGRKIACGPPLPGSVDRTCNQCQRRSLQCEYPSESRRGMRKKKVPAPADSDKAATDSQLPSTSTSS